MKKSLLLLLLAVTFNLSYTQESFIPVASALPEITKQLEANGKQIESVTMTRLKKNHIEYYTLKSGVNYGFYTLCSQKVKDFNCILHRNVRGGKWSKMKEETFSGFNSTIDFRPFKKAKYRYEVRINKKTAEYNNDYFILILYRDK